MAGSKDTVEVVKFLALFAKLKDLSNDEPGKLPKLAEDDEDIKENCKQLSWTAFLLKMNERRHRQLFAAPVDPAFVTEWRDFEERFEPVLSNIELTDLLKGLGNVERREGLKADVLWEIADDDAREQASAIEGAIDFAQDQASQDWRDFPDGFIEAIEDGMAAWQRLKREVGFDLRGIFRRRELIPFVLVPRPVAAKYGSETVSLFNNLQQAHDAFIFGTPFAALGLMRSVLEATLRDHYRIPGRNLDQCIKNADRLLPPGANTVALHRLQRLANAVLHLKERDQPMPKIEDAKLEKEIVSLLYVLRALIEGADKARS